LGVADFSTNCETSICEFPAIFDWQMGGSGWLTAPDLLTEFAVRNSEKHPSRASGALLLLF
jgi:hypothetical protein